MSVASVVNAVGNVANTLLDLSPKEFYSTRDFYNFIKKRQNAPMAVKHFTIVPKMQIFSMDGAISPVWDKIFTDTNLAKFAILTQRVSVPQNVGVNAVGTKQSPITTVHGRYNVTNNSFNGANNDTFTMEFLQTASPIIQTFIVPWYYQTLRTSNYVYNASKDKNDNLITQMKNKITEEFTNTANSVLSKMGVEKYKFGKDKNKGTKYISQYPIPKLTIDIKYYRMDQIAGLEFLMNPNFVYRLTGVYPISFNAPTTQHQADSYNITNRIVTFAYNNIICIPNATYEQKLFNGTHSAFAYKTQSPVQILNALNSGVQDVASIANSVKGF